MPQESGTPQEGQQNDQIYPADEAQPGLGQPEFGNERAEPILAGAEDSPEEAIPGNHSVEAKPGNQETKPSLKQELKETLNRHFAEVMGIFAKQSVGVVMETGEMDDGGRYTNTLFVLEDEKQTPEDLKEIVISLGLDASVSAHIFPEGGGLLVQTPVSDGKMEEILNSNGVTDEKLISALEEVRQKGRQHSQQINLLEVEVLHKSIAASLGNTYSKQ